MRAHASASLQGQRRVGTKGNALKALRILLCLVVFMALAGSSGSALSEAPALAAASGVLSGGQYVLAIQPAQVVEPSGYLLLEAAPESDAASGCCCKICLPAIQK